MSNFKASEKDKQYIICDGQLDAIYAESLMKSLDNNRKLILSNGEVIPITSSMKFIFLFENANVLSPAYVSRCNVLYLDSDMLSYSSFIKSYVNDLK
jgi:hypothetical protein